LSGTCVESNFLLVAAKYEIAKAETTIVGPPPSHTI